MEDFSPVYDAVDPGLRILPVTYRVLRCKFNTSTPRHLSKVEPYLHTFSRFPIRTGIRKKVACCCWGSNSHIPT